MTHHRYTMFRISRGLLVLLVLAQVAACGSSTSSSSDAGSSSGQSAGGIANLNWVAPSEREDGTPISLSEIAGYKVYYGSSVGEYPNQIDITDSSATEVGVTSLSPGRYYFVITTLDTDGHESEFSAEVSITIS